MPDKFIGDESGKKLAWFQRLENSLATMMIEKEADKLPAVRARNPAYLHQLPQFVGRNTLYQQTSSHDAPLPSSTGRDSFQLVTSVIRTSFSNVANAIFGRASFSSQIQSSTDHANNAIDLIENGTRGSVKEKIRVLEMGKVVSSKATSLNSPFSKHGVMREEEEEDDEDNDGATTRNPLAVV